MSLNVEHIESSQAVRIDKAEKPKAANGEGFAGLLATLSAELRSFSGINPAMALPIGAAKPANVTDDALARDVAPDTDRGSALDDGDGMEDQAAGLRPTESRSRSRSERPDGNDDRDARHADNAAPAAGETRRADSSDDDASEMTAGATTTVAGNARGGEQQAASGVRNAAVAQLPTGQAGAQQTIAEEIRTLAAARQAAAPTQSGAYKPASGADGNPMRAVIVDQGAGMASQPTASLAASATVNA